MEKGGELRSNNLYHLITGIVNPNLGCDNHGNVRLSKTKATPLSSQVLLSPNVYLKTVSSIITNDLHKMGHGIQKSYLRKINGQNGQKDNLV